MGVVFCAVLVVARRAEEAGRRAARSERYGRRQMKLLILPERRLVGWARRRGDAVEGEVGGGRADAASQERPRDEQDPRFLVLGAQFPFRLRRV